MIHSNRRSGATLTEVLVAIFVMAIGLLALLTLFPLGALSMAQAIKDNRTAHSGRNAFAIAQALNIHNDPALTNANTLGVLVNPGMPPFPPANSPNYFLNPYPSIRQLFTPPQQSNPPQYLAPDLYALSTNSTWLTIGGVPAYSGIIPYDGPSYPIYVDPIGWRNFPNVVLGGVTPPAAPGVGFSSIPRLPLSGLLNAPLANQWLDRWCTLSDDITFSAGLSPQEPTDAGTPSLSTGNVQRENRYTWAWLLRRPKAFDPNVVDVTVVVYSGRSLTSLGETPVPNPNLPLGPTNQFVAFDPGSKFVDIFYSGTKPTIRTGSWILDATMEYLRPSSITFNAMNIPDPHGFFYRVVGVTDVSSTQLRLELQTYPKKSSFIPPNTLAPGDPGVPPYGVLIVMENVVEVFEKGPGWQP
jgi:hypothetical protein